MANTIKTTYYLIDKPRLLQNMEKMVYVRERSSVLPPGQCST